jgi:integrase
MSIERRKGTPYWYMRFTFLGREVDRSTRTKDKRAAELCEQAEREHIHAEVKLGEKGLRPFGVVAEEWLASTRKQADRSRLDWFLAQEDTALTPIGKIDAAVIAAFRIDLEEGVPGKNTQRRKDGSPYRSGPRCRRTVDRHMTVLRSVLNFARKREIIETVPYVPMWGERASLPDYLTPEEYVRLRAELPVHLQIAADFAIATGLREQSMLLTTWDRIDLTRRHMWVPGEFMKGGEPFGLPLNDAAIDALKRARAYAPTGEYVFQYEDPTLSSLTDRQMRTVARELISKAGSVNQRELRAQLHMRFGRVGRTDRRQAICRQETAEFEARGKVARFDRRDAVAEPLKTTPRRLKRCGTAAFDKAVQRANLGKKNITWHSLRHTWASWAIQSGKVSDAALMAMGNWRTLSMMQNYAHLSTKNLETAANQISAYFSEALANQRAAMAAPNRDRTGPA